MADQSNIQSAASKSIRPFKSSEEYLYAMKEDLAEWLNTLYELELTADTFLDGLATGCALCRHANNVNGAAQDFQREHPAAARSMKVPSKDVLYQSRGAAAGSFVARDNVSNFIAWCRQELWIKDVLMFETNDLVEKCNEKNFVLCLLEVARRGSKFGMLAPMLIQLEEEIEEEIRDQESQRMDDDDEKVEEEKGEPAEQRSPSRCFSRKENNHQSSEVEVEAEENQPDPEPFMWQQKRVLLDMRNLDELVCLQKQNHMTHHNDDPVSQLLQADTLEENLVLLLWRTPLKSLNALLSSRCTNFFSPSALLRGKYPVSCLVAGALEHREHR